VEQARTSGIIRFPTPHDRGGGPCLPVHHPRSRWAWRRCDASPLLEAEPSHLLAYLATIPDPRSALGRRHPLVAILALAAAAVLAGARSFAAIAEWATDAPQPVRAALGAWRDAPDHWAVPAEATIRRTLGRLDANALAAAVGAWLADRQRHDRSHSVGHAQRGGHGSARWRSTARPCVCDMRSHVMSGCVGGGSM
jgi:hypothetical protein